MYYIDSNILLQLVWLIGIFLCTYLEMLQSVGYGGGGVQCDVAVMDREGGSVCGGLRPLRSPGIAICALIIGTGKKKKKDSFIDATIIFLEKVLRHCL